MAPSFIHAFISRFCRYASRFQRPRTRRSIGRHELMSPPSLKQSRGSSRSPPGKTLGASSCLPPSPSAASSGTGGKMIDRRLFDDKVSAEGEARPAAGAEAAPATATIEAAGIAAAAAEMCDGASSVREAASTLKAAAAAAEVASQATGNAGVNDGRSRSERGERCRDGAGDRDRYRDRERQAERAIAWKKQQQREDRQEEEEENRGGKLRKVERLSSLEEAAQGGDVVLFQCRGLLSRLQRWVLRSEWDHVGVVSGCACVSRR